MYELKREDLQVFEMPSQILSVAFHDWATPCGTANHQGEHTSRKVARFTGHTISVIVHAPRRVNRLGSPNSIGLSPNCVYNLISIKLKLKFLKKSKHSLWF